jgi:hypothetical protein
LVLEKADNKQKSEERPSGYAPYTWIVLVGAIKVAIVLGAFSAFQSKSGAD